MMELSVEQMVRAMKVLCFLQVGASFVAFVVNLNDKQNTDAVSMGQSVFASITGLITGIAGVYGATKKDRGALTFFFVVEMCVPKLRARCNAGLAGWLASCRTFARPFSRTCCSLKTGGCRRP